MVGRAHPTDLDQRKKILFTNTVREEFKDVGVSRSSHAEGRSSTAAQNPGSRKAVFLVLCGFGRV
jgi:hypothetical protein